MVVFLYADLAANVGLGDAKFLLDAELHGESVGVPAGAAAPLPACLRLVAADGVLDGTGHHVVDAGHAVGRRRTFKENELGLTLGKFETLLECPKFFPTLQNPVAGGHQIKSLIFFECHIFSLILRLLNSLQI